MSDLSLIELARRCGLPKPAYETMADFFVPKPDFAAWVKKQFGADVIYIDCGCGKGLMTRKLRAVGLQVVPLDYFPSSYAAENGVRDIIDTPAQEWAYNDQMLPIIARPCGGGWIRETIDAAIKGSGRILYIGVGRNYGRDLDGLPYHVECLRESVGADDESAWLITPKNLGTAKETKKMGAKRSFDRVLLIEYYGRTAWVGVKGDTKYWNCGMGRCPFNPETDKIVREFDYTDDDDLDRIEIEVLAEKCPKPSKPCARLGWLSPEGKFFTCAYCAHKELARLLSAKYYNDLNGDITLEKNGWAKLDGGGMFNRGRRSWDRELPPPPQAQIEAFGQIVREWVLADAEGKDLERLCTDNPEDFGTEMWFTSPADGLIEGFQREYADLTGEEYVGKPKKLDLKVPGRPVEVDGDLVPPGRCPCCDRAVSVDEEECPHCSYRPEGEWDEW